MSLKLLENRNIDIDERDVSAVVAAVQSGALSGTSPLVRVYETELAEYFGSAFALAVSSGTAALQVLLYAYGIGPGDEVILPPTAPVMTVLPIIASGACPVFVDIAATTFGLDLRGLELARSVRTRLIVTVPMWGYPTNVEEVQSLASDWAIPVIEDASHAHGTVEGNGRLAGRTSHASFFSTQERKMVSTGEGGFILTDDVDLARRVREIRDFGKIDPAHPSLAALAGTYGHAFGLNFRTSAIAAALGRQQLLKLDRKIAARTANAARLAEAVRRLRHDYRPRPVESGTPNHYSLVVEGPRGSDATGVGRVLHSRGIVSDIFRFGGVPLNRMPLFAEYRSADTPNAERALAEFVTLPTHEGLTESDLGRIERAIEETMGTSA
ncbi:DegT/DnrJ/EryC1/StrS family aminotransferase [Curtobacterium flaccumfaciens]|uniref:DegT/DnrJ/EryC1/StrS family aminotransferase n=1 Tax=Curtobacterium flaccumfaciens TaxID=2035 RepID=UPI00159A6D5E|nr:DegT/DnrJ/EryC1/StrS family aminotransferase [Curtobacterium flaccumfaciens]QKS88488.1 aspartate aminotransferase [Curtobacterium flaccumfaciens pv. flaccumfaciens]